MYLSAILGAGFASGREIMTYFGCYGYIGFLGLLLSCLLIGFCGAKALIIVKNKGIANPHELNVNIAGEKGGQFLTICCGIFSYSAYIIMLAGIKQLVNGNIFTIIVVSICAYAVLYKGFGTLVNICGILAPITIIFIIGLSLYGSIKNGSANVGKVEYDICYVELIIKALLYAGYNVLTSICVLGRCGNMIDSDKNAILGGAMGGIMLFLSGGTILFGLAYSKIMPGIYEMPVLAFYGEDNIALVISMLGAMLISAITGLTGTCVFFDKIVEEKKLGLILGLLAIPVSYVPFGSLMDYIYPIFGIIGIFFIIVLALTGDKNV